MLTPEIMTPRQKSAAVLALVVALVLLTGGRMGDSFGYRRMFLLGVAGFTTASLLCGLSQSDGQLVAARLLQGATGAIMGPQFMALMQVLYTPLERIAKLALFGVIGGLASIVGPVIGGLLISANSFGLGWRLIFLINLPVGLLAIGLGLTYLPHTRSSRPAGFDVAGTSLFGLAVAIAFAAANAGFLLCFAFALQNERGLTPLATGLLHVPFGLGAMLGIAVVSRRLLPRLEKWVLVCGVAVMALCTWLVPLLLLTSAFAVRLPRAIFARPSAAQTAG